MKMVRTRRELLEKTRFFLGRPKKPARLSAILALDPGRKNRLRDAFLTTLFLSCFVFSCQHSVMLETAVPSAEISVTPQGYTQTKLALGSDFPADILIPDIDGMRETAFILSASQPAGVLAIDISKTPLKQSSAFPIFLSPPGTGIPNNLWIQSVTQGFLITSSHLIFYNPGTGKIYQQINLLQTYSLPSGLSNSNESPAGASLKLSFPSDVAVLGNSIFVLFSNYLRVERPAITAPGVLLQFSADWDQNQIGVNPTLITTPYFNPVSITPIREKLWIGQSGVIDRQGGQGITQTESAISIWSPEKQQWVKTLSFGTSGLSFDSITTNRDETVGWIGSATRNVLYELDLVNTALLHGNTDPIIVSENGGEQHDSISDVSISSDEQKIYISSFNQSRVYIANLSRGIVSSIGDFFPIGHPAGETPENPSGANTGAGPSKTRPGIPGIDFSGPDLFILSGYPGALYALTTESQTSSSNIQNLSLHTDRTNLTAKGETANLSVTIKFQDGSTLSGVQHLFNHPSAKTVNAVVWSSDHPQVALVDIKGTVTPLSEGTAILSAKVGKISDQILMNVEPAPISNSSSPIPTAVSTTAGAACQDFVQSVFRFTPGTGAGFGSSQLPDIVKGAPQGKGDLQGGTHIVSLGRGGSIVLDFYPCEIVDGSGTDFIVFENAFLIGGQEGHPYAELGVVGVSEDGENFVEFECHTTSYPYTGCAGWNPIYSHPNNSISPFDVENAGGDLFDLANIGVERARFVRIRDISSPAPCSDSCGFDLDAIAIIKGETQ